MCGSTSRCRNPVQLRPENVVNGAMSIHAIQSGRTLGCSITSVAIVDKEKRVKREKRVIGVQIGKKKRKEKLWKFCPLGSMIGHNDSYISVQRYSEHDAAFTESDIIIAYGLPCGRHSVFYQYERESFSCTFSFFGFFLNCFVSSSVLDWKRRRISFFFRLFCFDIISREGHFCHYFAWLAKPNP